MACQRPAQSFSLPILRFAVFPILFPAYARFRLLSLAVAVTLIGEINASADPLGELAATSSFKNVDLEKLASGTVQITRGPAMSFPRGLAVESVYLLKKPVPKALELHEQWNPNKHPELKVFLHGELSAHPSLADFQKIGERPIEQLRESFRRRDPKIGLGRYGLQMSNSDVKAFSAASAAGAAVEVCRRKSPVFGAIFLFKGRSPFSPVALGACRPTRRPAKPSARAMKSPISSRIVRRSGLSLAL